MDDFEKVYDIASLYQAHLKTRRNKRYKTEVILFELDMANRLCALSDSLRVGSYLPCTYYHFKVFEPKAREIAALRYPDRVVQRCLCDHVLIPCLESRLIYDNAACRVGKGTQFSRLRLSGFMREHYRKHGSEGYFLKCDIRKYFSNIDHAILKRKLSHLPLSEKLMDFLYGIIDSFEESSGLGLPLGNQSSQWFALYYLDEIDRFIKEILRIKHYVRYMDDFIILHHDKRFLIDILERLHYLLREHVHLELNNKTQIIPLRGGINYLGFHFYLTDTGKVIRKLTQASKYRFTTHMRALEKAIVHGEVEYERVRQTLACHYGHLACGHTNKLAMRWVPAFDRLEASDSVR